MAGTPPPGTRWHWVALAVARAADGTGRRRARIGCGGSVREGRADGGVDSWLVRGWAVSACVVACVAVSDRSHFLGSLSTFVGGRNASWVTSRSWCVLYA